MNTLHAWNEWVLAVLVVLHVAAIAWYRMRLRLDLVGPMVDGRTDNPSAEPLRFRAGWIAALAFAIACGFVYWLVIVYPATP